MLGSEAHINFSHVLVWGMQEGEQNTFTPKKCSDYYAFGLTMPGRSSNTGNPNDNYKFTGHELDDEANLNIYHMNARAMDPALGRFMQIDPMAAQYPSLSPYAYVGNNPLAFIDPTGMWIDPVYDLEGNHLGNTEEGFTGEVLIYSGDEKVDFSEMSAADAKKMNGVDTYDNQRSTLSNNAKSSIWNNVVSKMEGAQIYDEKFSMSTIEGGIQYMDFGGSWGVPTSQAGKGKGNIYGSDKYGYETTVENIQSSVVVHEWYSHLQKGNRDAMKSHRLAYKNVINYKALWNNTTDRYKGFNMLQLRNYTERETGRTKVDPLYMNLYNKYSKKY